MSKKSVAQQEQEKQNQLNETNFLTLTSIQCTRLMFEVVKNYSPLIKVMLNYTSFDDFVKQLGEKKFNEVMNQ